MSGDRPFFVVRAADVPEQEGSYPPPFDFEKLSWGRDLARAAGSRRLGCWQERIPRGRRTSFTHAHLREEELVYVLSGPVVLRWIPPGEEARECVLDSGDYAHFPAGTGIAHTFRNDAELDAVLLCVGERHASDACAYPEDSGHEAWRAEHYPHRHWTEVVRPSGEASWPAYRIETERLLLRPWDPEDAQALVGIQRKNRDHLVTFMPWAQTVPSVSEALERTQSWQPGFLSGKDLVYGLFTHEGRPIGGCGLHDRVGAVGREIGYWIDADHEGKGLVSEAVCALTQVALAQWKEIDRLEIRCDPANVRSANVAKRLGFRHEATLARRVTGTDGSLRDSMVWAMYREDVAKSPVAAVAVRAWDGAGRRLL